MVIIVIIINVLLIIMIVIENTGVCQMIDYEINVNIKNTLTKYIRKTYYLSEFVCVCVLLMKS